MAGTVPSTHRSIYLLVVAVLLGLAAALLLAPPPSSPGVQFLPTVHGPALPSWVPAVLILAFVLLWLGVFVARRLGGGVGLSTSLLLNLAVIFGLLVVFEYLFQWVHNTTTSVPTSNVTNGTGSTGCVPVTSPICQNRSLPGGPSPPSSFAPWFDGYVLYAVLIAAVVAAVVLLPRLQAIWERGPRAVPPSATEGRTELEAALERLRSTGTGDEARTRIVRAYGELLRHVARKLPNLETSTPREIEQMCSRAYGIAPATAHELTELFEEARYSHGRPLGEEAVARAEAALRRALAEIEAGPGAPS